MTLRDYIESLTSDRQFDLGIRLTKLALPIWEKFADANELVYRDTVVGMQHTVDRDLLKNTIVAIEQSFISKTVRNGFSELRIQFDDPIVALQDSDWELPEEVQKVFYSIFNLLEAYHGKLRTIFDELTIYVSINQAVDAIQQAGVLTFDELKAMVYQDKNGR